MVKYYFLRILLLVTTLLRYNSKIVQSMVFKIFMELCNCDHLLVLEHDNYPLKKHLSKVTLSFLSSSPTLSPQPTLIPLCFYGFYYCHFRQTGSNSR